MAFATSHQQHNDPLAHAKRKDFLYDQPDHDCRKASKEPRGKIFVYTADSVPKLLTDNLLLGGSSASSSAWHCCSNSWGKGGRKLLVGDCGDAGDDDVEPSHVQAERVHRIFDVINSTPVENNEQLQRILGSFSGWSWKKGRLKTGWMHMKGEFSSHSSPCYEKAELPNLLEASLENLQAFAEEVNRVERKKVFEARTWTLYCNPLYASGRLSIVPSPRKRKEISIIPDMCKQEVFASEIRQHLYRVSTIKH